jgi:hypothetical protein
MSLRSVDRPVVSGAATLVAAVAFVLARVEVAGHGKIASFILAERRWVNAAQAPPGLPVLARNGYDGQFYYRLALDPADLHRTAFGITLDAPFRLQRIGYPVLAWMASLGHHGWVPMTLVAVNVVAITALAVLGGLLARDHGRHALCGLMFAGYFGFVFSLSRDTTEPLAAAFLLGGFLACRRQRWLLAAGLFACGCLTRETVLVAVAALALIRVVSWVRRGSWPSRPDAAWILPLAAFAAWQLIVHQVVGAYPYATDTSSNGAAPLTGIIDGFRGHVHQVTGGSAAADIWILEVAVLALFVVAAARSFASTEVSATERLAFVGYVLQMFVLSPSIWSGSADLRSLDEVFLLSLMVVLGTRRRSLPVLAVPFGLALLAVVGHRVIDL